MTFSKSFALIALAGCVSMAIGAPPAFAELLTYDVNMNFDPTVVDASPVDGRVGTITGTFTINSDNLDLTNIDLTEKTNSAATFGGAFGTQTFTSLTFGNSSLWVTYTAQAVYKFGGDPYLFVSVQSNCCVVDAVEVGPYFQFDFAYPQGSAVLPGNFDSITSGSNYLYGNVTTGVPEPATWVLMALGFAGLGFAGYRRAGRNASHAPVAA